MPQEPSSSLRESSSSREQFFGKQEFEGPSSMPEQMLELTSSMPEQMQEFEGPPSKPYIPESRMLELTMLLQERIDVIQGSDILLETHSDSENCSDAQDSPSDLEQFSHCENCSDVQDSSSVLNQCNVSTQTSEVWMSHDEAEELIRRQVAGMQEQMKILNAGMSQLAEYREALFEYKRVNESLVERLIDAETRAERAEAQIVSLGNNEAQIMTRKQKQRARKNLN